MSLRTFVVFEADVPSAEDGAFDGSAPPPGRPVAEALAGALAAAGLQVTHPPTEYEAYGWEFTVGQDRAAVWCLLQRSDAWLLITEAPVPWPGRLRGRTHEPQHRAVCEALDRALRAHPAIRDVQWFTRAEFEAGAAHRRPPEDAVDA